MHTLSLVVTVIVLLVPHGASSQEAKPSSRDKQRKSMERAAAKGDSNAQNSLADQLRGGESTPVDYALVKSWYEKAAAQGNDKAQNSLGDLFRTGLGVSVDKVKAREWYEKAASQGNLSAQASLGDLYSEKNNVFGDYIRSRTWYEKAANHGSGHAQKRLGDLYAEGLGVTADLSKAKEWYEKSAGTGNAFAQQRLGNSYYRGEGAAVDKFKARQWYEKAAAQGESNSELALGDMCFRGEGGQIDYVAARRWYEMAATEGHLAAAHQLGTIYSQGLGIEKDYAKSRAWYEKAVTGGHIESAASLGKLYEQGLGGEVDYARARSLYEMGSMHKDSQSQVSLGDLYRQGLGMQADNAKARQWYEEAGRNGNATALRKLADLYRMGLGVPLNFAKAREWYEKAAAQGDAVAETRLGEMYQRGQGVKVNYAQAAVLYTSATAQGDSDAENAIGDLYRLGLGVPQNLKEARRLYEHAAEHGCSRAAYNLAMLYSHGPVGSADDAMAKSWYERAAAMGDPDAKRHIHFLDSMNKPRTGPGITAKVAKSSVPSASEISGSEAKAPDKVDASSRPPAGTVAKRVLEKPVAAPVPGLEVPAEQHAKTNESRLDIQKALLRQEAGGNDQLVSSSAGSVNKIPAGDPAKEPKLSAELMKTPSAMTVTSDPKVATAPNESAEDLVHDGDRLLGENRLREAAAKYQEATQLSDKDDARKGLAKANEIINTKTKSALKEAHDLYATGKFKQALETLLPALELNPADFAVNYNTALCYHNLNNDALAVARLDVALQATQDQGQRASLEALKSGFTAGPNGFALIDSDKSKAAALNVSISQRETQLMNASLKKMSDTSPTPIIQNAGPGICDQLNALRQTSANNAVLFYNLAKCAEDEGRQEEAANYLQQYLKLAPSATDLDDIQIRSSNLFALAGLKDDRGVKVRQHFTAAAVATDHRAYSRALGELLAAENIYPELPATQWRLALYYEALGEIESARSRFNRYMQLDNGQNARAQALQHLAMLDKTKSDYDRLIAETLPLLAATLPDAAKNALATSQVAERKRSGSMLSAFGGMSGALASLAQSVGPTEAVDQRSFSSAELQLERASVKIQQALAIFPLGAAANQLAAFVYLQGQNPKAAMQAFDGVFAHGKPVEFYAVVSQKKERTMHFACVALGPSGLNLKFLQSYDAKKKEWRNDSSFGGDFRSVFTSAPENDRILRTDQMKEVATQEQYVHIKVTDGNDLHLLPISVALPHPSSTGALRKFTNDYTRLFIRYLGIEDARLGAEGMSHSETFMMVASMANSGASAVSAFRGLGTSLGMAQLTMNSLNLLTTGYGFLHESVLQRRQMIEGTKFRLIPTEPLNLGFRDNL